MTQNLTFVSLPFSCGGARPIDGLDRTAGVGRTGRYLHFWPAASGVRRDKNLAGGSRFHRADRGMARRPARSGCCATSHTGDKQCLRPRFSVRRVRLHLRARSLPGSRLTRCGRGVTCRFATDARENAVAAAAERHRDRQVAAAIRPQWRASLICFTTARACPC